MSEYLDAISRLEAPERPPMVKYIRKIPFMEYPQHDSEKDWNRVLAQGRNSRLPKYSISQRFNITGLDLGQTVYNFDLDKTFITAVGDRKSIAVRQICFKNDTYKDFNLLTYMTLDNGNTYFIDDERKVLDNDYDFTTQDEKNTFYEITETRALMALLAARIRECLRMFVAKVGLDETDTIKSFSIDNDKLKITFKLNHIRKGLDGSPITFPFYFACYDEEKDYYLFGNTIDGLDDRHVVPTIINDNTNKSSTIIYDFSNYVQRLSYPTAVCSTLNPYSVQNIIGNLEEYHDMLNKIYPYDRQNSFQLWFNDAEGNRILNKNITGYLDIELIVDNSNNINLDV